MAIAVLACGALLLYVSRSDLLYLPGIRLRHRIPILLRWIWRGAPAAVSFAALSREHDRNHFRIEYTKLVIQAVISVILVSASLYIILSSSLAQSEKHWASGTVGMILGFWLRNSRELGPSHAHNS